MYTDTFEPYTFDVDVGVYRQLVRDAVWPTVINMLLEAVLIAAIVAVFVLMRRRLRAGPRSA
jgi:hypothetical protein